jgi:hypothetical protein
MPGTDCKPVMHHDAHAACPIFNPASRARAMADEELLPWRHQTDVADALAIERVPHR